MAVVGKGMTWGEAIRLTERLSLDPSSHIAASLGELDYPLAREALVLMDLFDLQHAAASRKRGRPKPYPRPWRDRSSRRLGNARLTPEELRAILAKHREG